MRNLTAEEIEKFSSRPRVKKIASENFLMTMGHDYWTAASNLRRDAKLYKWNRETVHAIGEGIRRSRGE